VAYPSVRTVGSTSLWLSLLTFAVYFLNVLLGGPLNGHPWMTDVQEMLTLYAAVILFVIGTLCREAEANRAKAGQGNRANSSSTRNAH
jgi:hypothetical protein